MVYPDSEEHHPSLRIAEGVFQEEAPQRYGKEIVYNTATDEVNSRARGSNYCRSLFLWAFEESSSLRSQPQGP